MQNCHMWDHFLHGKTHDLYGLLIIIVIELASVLTSHNALDEVKDIIIMLISGGIFADLWAHCFHH